MAVSEDILIDAMKRNSEQAFEKIYQLYADRLFAFCMQYTKSHEKSEELVEDTFVWLWVNRHRIHQEQTLKALLFIRVRHYLINAYRTTVNSPEFAEYCEYVKQIADGSSASEEVEYDEFVSHLSHAMNRLTETQRKVVSMSKLEQKSNTEISVSLGLTEQTVRNQLYLGLKTLRHLL